MGGGRRGADEDQRSNGTQKPTRSQRGALCLLGVLILVSCRPDHSNLDDRRADAYATSAAHAAAVSTRRYTFDDSRVSKRIRIRLEGPEKCGDSAGSRAEPKGGIGILPHLSVWSLTRFSKDQGRRLLSYPRERDSNTGDLQRKRFFHSSTGTSHKFNMVREYGYRLSESTSKYGKIRNYRKSGSS